VTVQVVDDRKPEKTEVFSLVLWDAVGEPLELCDALKRQPTDTIRTLAGELRSACGQYTVRGWVHA
jgi:hypothetical protein